MNMKLSIIAFVALFVGSVKAAEVVGRVSSTQQTKGKPKEACNRTLYVMCDKCFVFF